MKSLDHMSDEDLAAYAKQLENDISIFGLTQNTRKVGLNSA